MTYTILTFTYWLVVLAVTLELRDCTQTKLNVFIWSFPIAIITALGIVMGMTMMAVMVWMINGIV
ncbi:MAG: hypothetical protein GY928_23880 [Colwellia sp.]|nr:hypothetical protein [Colwellia sp.]